MICEDMTQSELLLQPYCILHVISHDAGKKSMNDVLPIMKTPGKFDGCRIFLLTPYKG